MVTPHPAGDTEAQPPPTTLDRDAFTRTRVVPALRVETKATTPLLKALRGHTLDVPKQPCVVKADDRDDEHRFILLKEEVEALPERAAAAIAAASATPTTHALTLTYAHLSADAVLAALLPPGVTPPSAFETVGHIAHVNLRPEHSPHRHAIATVLLDKNPGLRTVVNKVGTITNEFRVFDMEVLAGEDDTVTTVTQHGARFTLDYRRVYWNSRLETEHARLVSLFSPSDVVVDVMAGVGPFAIPAGRSGVCVFANDLNPASHHWLETNVARNKVAHAVHTTCADGRAFVRACGGGDGGGVWARVFGGETEEGAPDAGAATTATAADKVGPPSPKPPLPPPPRTGVKFDHAILNLPAAAPEFLDAFVGALNPALYPEGHPLPLIHVYAFARAGEEASIAARAASALGVPALPTDSHPTMHLVRDVAPNKHMWCLSFRLPRGVGLAGEGDPAAKRARVGD